MRVELGPAGVAWSCGTDGGCDGDGRGDVRKRRKKRRKENESESHWILWSHYC